MQGYRQMTNNFSSLRWQQWQICRQFPGNRINNWIPHTHGIHLHMNWLVTCNSGPTVWWLTVDSVHAKLAYSHSVACSVTDAMASPGVKPAQCVCVYVYDTTMPSFSIATPLVCGERFISIHWHPFVQGYLSVVWSLQSPLYGGSICIVWLHVYPCNSKMSTTWRCPLLGESIKRGSTVPLCYTYTTMCTIHYQLL